MSPAQDHHYSLDGDDLRRASKRSLIVALVLKVGYMFADIIGGVLSGSLALLAHAGHMLADVASIALALVAMHFAGRAASVERTFGYHRLEILAALLNALTLWLIAALGDVPGIPPPRRSAPHPRRTDADRRRYRSWR